MPGEVQLLLPRTALVPRSQSRMDASLQPPAAGIVTFPKVTPGQDSPQNAGPLVNCEHRKIFDQKKK